jgi:hypothetical protein
MNFSARPAGTERFRRGKNRCAGCLAGCLALACVQAAPPSASSGSPPPEYQPDNVFVYPAKLAVDFRRVAVLPVAAGSGGTELADGCQAMTPVMLEQLVKTKRFEVISVDPENLRRSTGQSSWTGTEVLPPDFLDFLRREYDCDGVLFAELTSYHAYAPLAIGWRLKLVNARSGQIIWAADELFDAAQPAVERAAQHFNVKGIRWPFSHDDDWLTLNSPRQFGRYSATAVLGTLPQHLVSAGDGKN